MPRVTETTVTRADAPNLLEYNWGDFNMRWELEALGDGTRLTLWTNIGHRFIAMGAAGGTFASMFWITFSVELRSDAWSAQTQ